MQLKDKMILEEYRKRRKQFLLMEEAASEKIAHLIKEHHIEVHGIEHRVKAEDSLAGKLNLKGDKYRTLDDLTDILGMRIICYFVDDLDRVGVLIENTFVVDRENSSDKRALIKADSFGYLSVHYIVSFPSDQGWPEEICGVRFEIQVRTILQHTWADRQAAYLFRSCKAIEDGFR